MERLSALTLHKVSSGVTRPTYDRQAMPLGIVHLGLSTLHRGHQAVYTDSALQSGDRGWGIVGVSLSNPRLSDVLTPQDGLYTLVVNDEGNERARIIGSIGRTLCLAQAQQPVIDALVSTQTEIVSLTITEKAYCLDPLTGGLLTTHPDIGLDLNAPHNPRSVIGVLAWSIYQRKLTKRPPFTLLSCDNMPLNGKVLQRVLADYIERVQADLGDSALLQYFLDQYASPCSFLDRTFPLIRSTDVDRLPALIGLADAAPVFTEAYSQWIIQDWFSGPRPRWEEGGAIFSPHLGPYEQMAFRLRDAAYCAVAHLGVQAGIKTVAQAMADPDITSFIDGLIDAAVVTLDKRTGVDWRSYKRDLLARLSNTSSPLTTAQLAIDASDLLPEAILEPARFRLARGLDIQHHALVLAAWIRCLTGFNERLEELIVNDTLSNQWIAAVKKAGGRQATANDLVEAVMAVHEVFGLQLPGDDEFTRSVVVALEEISANRVLPTLANFASTRSVR